MSKFGLMPGQRLGFFPLNIYEITSTKLHFHMLYCKHKAGNRQRKIWSTLQCLNF